MPSLLSCRLFPSIISCNFNLLLYPHDARKPLPPMGWKSQEPVRMASPCVCSGRSSAPATLLLLSLFLSCHSSSPVTLPLPSLFLSRHSSSPVTLPLLSLFLSRCIFSLLLLSHHYIKRKAGNSA